MIEKEDKVKALTEEEKKALADKEEQAKQNAVNNEQIYTALKKLAKNGTLRLKENDRWLTYYFMTKAEMLVWYKDKEDELQCTVAQPRWIGRCDFRDLKDVIIDGGGVFRARFIVKKRPKLVTVRHCAHAFSMIRN